MRFPYLSGNKDLDDQLGVSQHHPRAQAQFLDPQEVGTDVTLAHRRGDPCGGHKRWCTRHDLSRRPQYHDQTVTAPGALLLMLPPLPQLRHVLTIAATPDDDNSVCTVGFHRRHSPCCHHRRSDGVDRPRCSLPRHCLPAGEKSTARSGRGCHQDSDKGGDSGDGR